MKVKQPDQRGSLSVVIPVYNGAATIAPLVERTIATLRPNLESLEVVLVNDGSRDETDGVIRNLIKGRHGSLIKYVNLARNFGEHNAVLCGLRHAEMEAAVIIDDDFQNPPEEIERLINKLHQGYDVVYSYYDKKHHSLFRNIGSWFNDVVARRLLGKPKDVYLSSFKALNRFLIDVVTMYDGPYPYIDGLILRATSRIGTQHCRHAPRSKGQSNYTFKKLVSLWLNMFTSFSVSPLRVAFYLGLAMAIVGFMLAIFFTLSWMLGGVFTQDIPRGWASTIVTLTVFSGVQLMILGLIGEYIGRIFMTQNKQPQVIVREVVHGGKQPEGSNKR